MIFFFELNVYNKTNVEAKNGANAILNLIRAPKFEVDKPIKIANKSE